MIESDELCSEDSLQSAADELEIGNMLGNQKQKTKKGRKKKGTIAQPVIEQPKQSKIKEQEKPRIIVQKKASEPSVSATNHVFKAKLVNESVIKREGSNDRVPVKSTQSTYKTYPTHQQ